MSPLVSGMSSRVRCLASRETSRTKRRSLERSSDGGGLFLETAVAVAASASTRAGVPAAALVLLAFPLRIVSCSPSLMCRAKSLATKELAEVRGREEMHARQLLADGDRASSSGEAALAADPEEATELGGGLHLVSSAVRSGSAAARRSSREEELPDGGKGSGTTFEASSPASSAAESFRVSSAEDQSQAACSSAVAVEIVRAAARDWAKAAADFLGGRCCCGVFFSLEEKVSKKTDIGSALVA